MSMEALRDLLAQDSRACRGKMNGKTFEMQPAGNAGEACWLNRCAVEQDSEFYNVLRNAVDRRKLPEIKSSIGSKVENVLCYTDERRLPDVGLTEGETECRSGYKKDSSGKCVADPYFIGPILPEDYFEDDSKKSAADVAKESINDALKCKGKMWHECKILEKEGKCWWDGLPAVGECKNVN